MADTAQTVDLSTKDTIIDATMALLADRPFDEVSVRDIAAAAGISLAELNQAFATRLAIIAAFSRRIDRNVLAQGFSDMDDEPARERLFDVLMARLDALKPYRGALEGLMASARRDPGLALALNGIAARSQAWMLAAAGIDTPGWRGRVAVQSLTVAFARVLRTFAREEDPGLPRTMAQLDKELRELGERHGRLARIFGGALRATPPRPHASAFEDFAHAEPAAQREPSPEAQEDAIGPAGAARQDNAPIPPEAPIDAPLAPPKPAPPETTSDAISPETGAAQDPAPLPAESPIETPPGQDAADPPASSGSNGASALPPSGSDTKGPRG